MDVETSRQVVVCGLAMQKVLKKYFSVRALVEFEARVKKYTKGYVNSSYKINNTILPT
jgi:hypothetical protein